jgi:hypothetical protein
VFTGMPRVLDVFAALSSHFTRLVTMFATRTESGGTTDVAALSRHLLELLQRNELLASRVDELVRVYSAMDCCVRIALPCCEHAPLLLAHTHTHTHTACTHLYSRLLQTTATSPIRIACVQ